MDTDPIAITRARTTGDLEIVRELFHEYSDSLGVDLEYQGFAAEVSGLPGSYAEPQGCLLLARAGDEIVGCVAMRPLDAATCEMKRLYVRSRFRGRSAGRKLVEELITIARAAGYTEMKLDTLAAMTSAQRLYEFLGFCETLPYNERHRPDTRFYSLRLSR